jgi:hypothetical protein
MGAKKRSCAPAKIGADEFARFLRAAPAQTFDCMLECKKKDLALLRLHEHLKAQGLGEAVSAVA